MSGTFAPSQLVNNVIRTSDIMGIGNIKTCKYGYTFELIPVNGTSSGEQPGDPNIDGMLYTWKVVF